MKLFFKDIHKCFDPAGNSNVEESLRGTLCPVFATASPEESPSELSLRCLQMWPAKHTDGASSGRLHSDDQVSPTEPPETGN